MLHCICLTQCSISPSHRLDEVVDCGLWNVTVMNYGPSVDQVWISDKGHTWAITLPIQGQLWVITLAEIWASYGPCVAFFWNPDLVHTRTVIHKKCVTKMHHQTPMTCTYGYSHFIHFKTVASEVEIIFLSTLIYLFPQFGTAFFSSKEGGCSSTFVHIMNVQVISL